MLKKTLSNAKSTATAALAVLTLSVSASAAIPTYFQDFEAMTPEPPSPGNSDLDDNGWRVGGNVFDGDTSSSPFPGNLSFDYFDFPAPNVAGGSSFSSVATGDTVPSGANYLNIFSDYKCCTGEPPTAGHGDTSAPFDVVNAVVFRNHDEEITIDEIGSVVTFSFDYKRPAFVPGQADPTKDDSPAIGADGCNAPQCTANAFIKVLSASNDELIVLRYDTTGASQSDWANAAIVLPILDSGLLGGTIQFGFETIIQSGGAPFKRSGVYYDNVGITVQTFGLVDKSVPVPAFAAAVLGLGLVAITVLSARRRRV
ncbi:MAG: hypothetical protein KJP25_00650 [Gammaproteobacteria bacterium]|nr:hypothetical protein [Gammaproteobacteria bacterium]MBT8151415.1 hypothetical protein [Gammaproteobacteria bacterium]NNM10321.1 hypothetical protein [Pseudomonadales bacterium]